MDYFELIYKRESVRGYLDKSVEREKIERLIEAARVAPSACNAQPWKFIVVDDKELVNQVAKKLYDPLVSGINKFALTSPAFIVVVAESRNLASKMGEIIKKKDYTNIDIGGACENICLAATELGLGTCIMGWFKEKGIKNILSIPSSKKVNLVISLGYYEEKEPRKKVRKDIKEIMSYNRY